MGATSTQGRLLDALKAHVRLAGLTADDNSVPGAWRVLAMDGWKAEASIEMAFRPTNVAVTMEGPAVDRYAESAGVQIAENQYSAKHQRRADGSYAYRVGFRQWNYGDGDVTEAFLACLDAVLAHAGAGPKEAGPC